MKLHNLDVCNYEYQICNEDDFDRYMSIGLRKFDLHRKIDFPCNHHYHDTIKVNKIKKVYPNRYLSILIHTDA